MLELISEVKQKAGQNQGIRRASDNPLDTGRKLNVLCTFNLHPVRRGNGLTINIQFLVFLYFFIFINYQFFTVFLVQFLRYTRIYHVSFQFSTDLIQFSAKNSYPVGIYLFKVNIGNTRVMCQLWSKLTQKVSKRHQ